MRFLLGWTAHRSEAGTRCLGGGSCQVSGFRCQKSGHSNGRAGEIRYDTSVDERGPKQRVSAVRFPESYELPAVPEGASGEATDAYRQTQFLLRSDLRLFEEGMRLQLRILGEASHSSFRTHAYASLVGLWSRTYLALGDACVLVTRGSYGSAVTLVRAACEHIAAQQQLHESEMPQFIEWLAASLSPSEEHRAVDIGLGRFVAGGALAVGDRLGAVYRAVSDLSRPSFGATLLFVGPESNNQRLALAFGDQAFHFAWAQLVLGWMLALCARQLRLAVDASDVFGESAERRRAVDDFASRVDVALAKGDRCRIEEIEVEGMRRYLVQNFRRAPGGAARRMLL